MTNETADHYRHRASFRDPDAFVFHKDGQYYRQVNYSYQPDYDACTNSGLYDQLIASDQLIAHKEILPNSIALDRDAQCYKLLSYDRLPFVSYPYEWCFGQLKDAALLTLSIQEQALQSGLSLKDASAYNVQWLAGRMQFIDTTSFEIYQEGKPWIAYHQFCKHFLAPLLLMHYTDIRLGHLFYNYLDGTPLDLAVKLLPARAFTRIGVLMHLYMHSKAVRRYEATALPQSESKFPGPGPRVSKRNIEAICDSLRSLIQSLQPNHRQTQWQNYYQETNYSQEAVDHKSEIIRSLIKDRSPSMIWDIGANTGRYSQLIDPSKQQVIAFDIDPMAVHHHYERCKDQKVTSILPLILDVTSPTPSLGWQLNERDSITKRGPADMVLALALMHHLRITYQVPFDQMAQGLAKWCRYLVIEYVPMSDGQVTRLLAGRSDHTVTYDQAEFEASFGREFTIIQSIPIRQSQRCCYVMERRDDTS